MLFFFIVLSLAVLLGVALLVRDGFFVWATCCFILGLWGVGIIVFVAQHFISKYW